VVVKFYLVVLDFSHMVFQNIIVASLEDLVVVRKVFFVIIIGRQLTLPKDRMNYTCITPNRQFRNQDDCLS
jgi:hypothetical protein